MTDPHPANNPDVSSALTDQMLAEAAASADFILQLLHTTHLKPALLPVALSLAAAVSARNLGDEIRDPGVARYFKTLTISTLSAAAETLQAEL